MGKIKVTHDCNGIEGLKVIEPAVFGDARGYFMETYNYNDFKMSRARMIYVRRNIHGVKKLFSCLYTSCIAAPKKSLFYLLHGKAALALAVIKGTFCGYFSSCH